MTLSIRKINIRTIIKLSSIVFSLSLFSINEVLCQRDSSSLAQLIKETNDLFIYRYAQGLLLSPYEIQQHHRDRTIKNIEWVNAFDLYKFTSSRKDTIPFIIKNNQTIVQKPDERFNSRTYSYYKGGRIHKIFRGNHLQDLFLNDEDGFLIQHGFGGELKRAKRKDKVFEWYNVKNDRLEFITSYDEADRLSKIKTSGHYFGPGVEYEIEEYSWQGDHLMLKNTIRKYKEGDADTTSIKFTYDNLGLIASISYRNHGQTTSSNTHFDTEIQDTENKHLKITIANTDKPLLSITFDHYDNVVEMINPYNQQRRKIKYRERKRRN